MDVSVEEVKIVDHSIVSIEAGTATVVLPTEISFSAEAEYKDLDTAIYDEEEKRYVFWDTIETTVSQSVRIPVELTVSFRLQRPRELSIVKTRISNDEDIPVRLDEGWPYK